MEFRLINKDLKFPPLYPKVERVEPTVKQKGFVKVGDYTLRHKIDIIPQRGLQEDLCASDCNLIFICGQATSGKAQPYDAKVLTPNGFVDMGSLKVGDAIMDVRGQTQTVVQIFEQGERDVYKVSFEDGTSTESDIEHLWNVDIRHKSNPYTYKFKTLTLSRIKQELESGAHVCIPYCAPIEFGEKCLPISPYTLGVYLGDGFSPRRGNPQVCINQNDLDIISYIRDDGYLVSKIPSHIRDYTVSGRNINEGLTNLGLRFKKSFEKFIPKVYKFGAVKQRLDLLQGLMDTDGCISNRGCAMFTTSSKQLADDVAWLCRSLGGRCSVTLQKEPKYTYKGEKKIGRPSYWVRLNLPPELSPVKTKRKLANYSKKHRQRPHSLTSIEKAGRKQCRCILVSSPECLYITDDFIVTHNTYGMFMKVLEGVGLEGYTARFINVRLQDSKKGSSIFRDAVDVCGNFAGCEYNASDYPTFVWKQWNNALQLIHSNFNADNPSEWVDFQNYAKKVQSSMICIDEATEIRQFKMFAYWWSRNRDSSGHTPQMILSFNPSHEHWTTAMLKYGGYLGEDWYLRPEMMGVVRYFYNKGESPEEMVWGDTREEVADAAGLHDKSEDLEAGITRLDYVKSFTVFTGTASGNRELVFATGGQSVANLHATGATQRAIVGEAYFGPVESESVSVTRKMVSEIFTNPTDEDQTMYATLDVSMGEKGCDRCPMVIWRGHTIIAIEYFPGGGAKELVHWINLKLRQYNIDVSNFAFDATGIGNYLKDYTSGEPVTANARARQELDEYGNPIQMEQYFNLRSQLLGKTRVMFERGDMSCSLDRNARLPYGRNGETRSLFDILCDEINVFVTTDKNGKIYYKSKSEYKERFHSSPDLMDSVTLRAVFDINARQKKKPKAMVLDDAYDGLYNGYCGGWSTNSPLSW